MTRGHQQRGSSLSLFILQKHKREPPSDSPSVVRKHTPLSLIIIYTTGKKNSSQLLAYAFKYVSSAVILAVTFC